VAITDRREKELSDLGFIPLCHCKGTDYAVFFGGQTVNKPRKYDTRRPTPNADLSSQLRTSSPPRASRTT
jgi:type VI secretion system protein ImpC